MEHARRRTRRADQDGTAGADAVPGEPLIAEVDEFHLLCCRSDTVGPPVTAVLLVAIIVGLVLHAVRRWRNADSDGGQMQAATPSATDDSREQDSGVEGIDREHRGF